MQLLLAVLACWAASTAGLVGLPSRPSALLSSSSSSSAAGLSSPSSSRRSTQLSAGAFGGAKEVRKVFGALLCSGALLLGGGVVGPTPPAASASASAAAVAQDVGVYFGVGCFWHVQHEFVETEKKVLQRGVGKISSKAGYAGGLAVGKDSNRPDNKDGIVCYHNLLNKGDYGQLGYGEVVGMEIPPSSVRAFADEYFSLFAKDLDRPDKGDRGPEYRSLLGLPGGTKSPLYADVAAAAQARGLTLLEGKGNDPDTLGKKAVWVMDTATFPFRQAELYHQFHDGFMPGEQYGDTYHSLRADAVRDGRISATGCPDI